MKEWLRLKEFMPERFNEVRDWEQEQRDKGGARANRSILKDRRGGETKPMTLATLEENNTDSQVYMFVNEGDQYGCFCEY